MNYDDIIANYDSEVHELSEKYESVPSAVIHNDLLRFLPSAPATILDIGAGTGRDAAWFCKLGFEVVAVEPSKAFLEVARRMHPDSRITWIRDQLPELTQLLRQNMTFDVIVLSAVWMHIAPNDRKRVFRKLVSLLKPGGVISISLRHGPHRISESTHEVTSFELEQLAVHRGLSIGAISKSDDCLSRDAVKWETVILRLPDDGTGALPQLRHIIINDSKSSTYKLALLRTLVRIADSASGLAKLCDDNTVLVPLGLVALYWLRLFKPLIESGIPQKPSSKDKKGLSFVKDSFLLLHEVSPFELRVGGEFKDEIAVHLVSALKDAARTIREQPANFITYSNSSESIFKVSGTAQRIRKSETLYLTPEFLWSFGEMTIPIDIWNSFSRYAAWIEPSLIFEWCELMLRYSESHGKKVELSALMDLLKWLDPERDTNLVRSLVSNSIQQGRHIHCVWSGSKIKLDRYDVDHCFPFSAWPCNDLWNLLPTRRDINSKKKDKLISSNTLFSSRERIETWWQHAYFSSEDQRYNERFRREAITSLPLIEDSRIGFFDSMFDALQLKRAGLKQNQNLAEWEP